MTTVKFGCQLPQETSNVSHILEVARECESLGYDSVWAYDHLAPFWIRSRSSLDGWSLLSAVGARTSSIKIGSLVTNVNFRNPSLLAKMTSTVDNISGGRLIVGLGIGDRMSIDELRSYGYRFPPFGERVTLLHETITILKTLWTGDDASFEGKVVNLSHAFCEPKPIQPSGPPIWVGGRHRRLLDVTAELADGWNHWGVTAEKVRELEAHLYSKCRDFRRPPGSITQSWAGAISTLQVSSSKAVDDIRQELNSQVGKRTSYFIASFPPAANRKAYEHFAEAVKSFA